MKTHVPLYCIVVLTCQIVMSKMLKYCKFVGIGNITKSNHATDICKKKINLDISLIFLNKIKKHDAEIAIILISLKGLELVMGRTIFPKNNKCRVQNNNKKVANA